MASVVDPPLPDSPSPSEVGRGGRGVRANPNFASALATSLPDSPSLLYVSTLDHIIRVMLPHLDAGAGAGMAGGGGVSGDALSGGIRGAL